MGAIADSFISILDNFVRRYRGAREQGERSRQAFRDARMEPESFSVESMMSLALSDLTMTGFQWRFAGESTRARLMDEAADRFVRKMGVRCLKQCLEFGDAIVVPMWDGNGFEHAVVPRDSIRILGCAGDEITKVAYVAETKTVNLHRYALVQMMELVGYDSEEGRAQRADMTLHVVSQDGSVSGISAFPDWAGRYDEAWSIPNVEALPIARLKCFKDDPMDPNGVYGVPICHGASEFIREIHYLVGQRHSEFELGEKAIIADKTMFTTARDGSLTMPRGRQRLYMLADKGRGGSVDDGPLIKEWAPSIQNTPYDAAIEENKRLVEQAVGVDAGIISRPENASYENVDAVRKSMRKTQAFVEAARDVTETALYQLARAWDTLLDYYGQPTGTWEASYKWSDDYINTFADKRDALAQGYQMGATDALDYRVFVTGEPVEEAKARIEEIASGRASSLTLTVPEDDFGGE